MSVTIKYKGNTIASANTDTTKTLKTSGKYCEGDIVVENIQDGGITPSGSVTLTEENTYDVTDKAQAVVDMSATRANLAEAVTAKGVDTLPTSSFDTIATNIGLISGGGGLPSVITKIDGGSFTPTEDTRCDRKWFEHNLGAEPKGFIVWATTLPPCLLHNCCLFYEVFYYQFDTYSTSNYVGKCDAVKLWKDQLGAQSSMGSFVNATLKASSLDGTTKIRWYYDSLYYEAGITYNWIAWA